MFFRSEPPRPHMKGNENRSSGWYQRWDLNPRPPTYEAGALNQLSYSGISRHIKIKSTLYSSNIRLIVFIIAMNKVAGCVLWRLQGDLNPWPPAWQAGVLTNWTMEPYKKILKTWWGLCFTTTLTLLNSHKALTTSTYSWSACRRRASSLNASYDTSLYLAYQVGRYHLTRFSIFCVSFTSLLCIAFSASHISWL